ncbi:MAG: DegT/DnrJ/EryC1/StrS family aminotransferase [Pseudomonadota bacterium]
MNAVNNLALERESRVGTIAFIDLKAQQKRIRANVEKRLMAVLDHGRYIAGPEIEELEKSLAEKVGVRHCVACSSGTDALIIPMMGLNLTRSDAVFIPGFTYNATANAVLVAGGTPVFVDIDVATLNMCAVDLEKQVDAAKKSGLTPRVVCPVDLFGAPADYPALSAVASAHKMLVFADGAQSFGGQQGGKWVGSLAPVTGTSFFPGKAMGAYGDAGATFTDDDEMAALCQSIRWHGTDEQRAQSVRVGINGRMSTFQAAVLLEKNAIFWDELETRRQRAATYDKRLANVADLQRLPDQTDSGYGYYTVQVKNRDRVRALMGEAGVPTAVYYMVPLHKMPAFTAYAPEGGLPQCEAASQRVLSLPMHPYLTDDQANFVCDVLEAAQAEAAA